MTDRNLYLGIDPGAKHDWIKEIRKGDILVEGDTPRIVRNVQHGKNGYCCVTLAIRRCSWTRRCYTVINASDLKQRRFRPTGKRVRLDLPIDKAIEIAIQSREYTLTCCDVEGVG